MKWRTSYVQSLLPPSNILSDRIFWRLPLIARLNLAIVSSLKRIRLFLDIEDISIFETPFLFKSLLHLCADLCYALTGGFWNAIFRGRGFGRSWRDAARGCTGRTLALGFQNAFIPLGTIFQSSSAIQIVISWEQATMREACYFLNYLRGAFGDNIAFLGHFFEVYLSIG